MVVDIFNSIVRFFENVGTLLGVDTITLIAFGLLILTITMSLIVTSFSIEIRTNNAVKRINSYLSNNPFVTNENIVEFNRLMKKIPKSMRYQWQRYMVNRSDKPSKYLSEDNCIVKPFRTSAFVQTLKQLKYVVGIICIASFLLTLGALYSGAESTAKVILKSSTIPLVVSAVGILFLMLLSARRNAVLSDLFYNFDSMERYLDRAVTTFPEFVDYEILFTRKEIIAGIPALQEYLQQRAAYEQEQLERARLSQVEHEDYDFSALGVKGSIIMDRAMKECEYYLGNRRVLLTDITTLQTEKEMLTKNFDENNRISQRKLRDIKETLDRLREKLNTTTNKIVGNDIMKQQADEIKKQQVIEKEVEEDTNRYNQELAKIEEHIKKKRGEIEENRSLVEKVLIGDFKDYSDRIYKELKNIASDQVKNEFEEIKNAKTELEKELEEREQYIAEKNALYEEKMNAIDEFNQKIEEKQRTIDAKENKEKEIKNSLEQKEKEIARKNDEIIGSNKVVESRNAEIKRLESEILKRDQKIYDLRKAKFQEIYRYFDINGNEFFYDADGNPFYYNEKGQVVYYTAQDKERVMQESPKRQTKEDMIPEPASGEPETVSPQEETEIVLDISPEVRKEKKKAEKEKAKPKEASQDSQEMAQLEKEIEAQNKELESQHEELKKQIEIVEEVKSAEADKQKEVIGELDDMFAGLSFGREEESVQTLPAEEVPAEAELQPEPTEPEETELQPEPTEPEEKEKTEEKEPEEKAKKPTAKKVAKAKEKSPVSAKKPASPKPAVKKPAEKKVADKKSIKKVSPPESEGEGAKVEVEGIDFFDFGSQLETILEEVKETDDTKKK